jgi:hypothetical protein
MHKREEDIEKKNRGNPRKGQKQKTPREEKPKRKKKRNNPKGRGAWHSTLYSLPPPLFINFLSSSSS